MTATLCYGEKSSDGSSGCNLVDTRRGDHPPDDGDDDDGDSLCMSVCPLCACDKTEVCLLQERRSAISGA